MSSSPTLRLIDVEERQLKLLEEISKDAKRTAWWVTLWSMISVIAAGTAILVMFLSALT